MNSSLSGDENVSILSQFSYLVNKLVRWLFFLVLVGLFLLRLVIGGESISSFSGGNCGSPSSGNK